jgi:hypothetical protein
VAGQCQTDGWLYNVVLVSDVAKACQQHVNQAPNCDTAVAATQANLVATARLAMATKLSLRSTQQCIAGYGCTLYRLNLSWTSWQHSPCHVRATPKDSQRANDTRRVQSSACEATTCKVQEGHEILQHC